MKKCESCGKDIENTKILSAIECFGKTLCQPCFFSAVRGDNEKTSLFTTEPLKIPAGDKEETYEHTSLGALAAQLRQRVFTGYLQIKIPDYLLTPGSKGKVLFMAGEIIAASFETGAKIFTKAEALEKMFNYHNLQSHGKIIQYAYGEAEVWQAVETNKNQLFIFEDWDEVFKEIDESGEILKSEEKPAQILVVDDNGDVRRLVGMTMKADGHDVVESDGGEDCLKKLRSGLRPDLIILDVMMPGMDGWAVSREIKDDENLKNIPICILTAKSDVLDVSMSLEHAKADVHLNKPISREKLVETVDWLLDSRGTTA